MAPEIIDVTPTVWHHISELWPVVAGIVMMGVAWGRMEMGVSSLKRDHIKLKEEVDGKADRSTCERVHISQRDSMDLVLKTIEKGNMEIREDIRHMTKRLDDHITANGKARG